MGPGGGVSEPVVKEAAMLGAGAPIENFESIDSTMLEARRRAERGAFGPVWLLARRQKSGRGRRGRLWASIDGNLMATLLCPNARAPAELALVGFAAGLAIAEALESFARSAPASLKWPNDVMIGGAKAAGLMLDSGAGWMALGIGINLAAAPEGLDQKTTSLSAAMERPAPSPLAFLAALAPRLALWDARLAGEGFAPLRDAWMARAHGLGAQTRVVMGDRIVEGRLAGLSPRGELELDTPDGLLRVAAGDVLISATEAA
jgi:BirA family transcriptional regulator, biotin operon repressor / biotin---[acetyl-CoA-carboxylase] ligase